MTDVVLILAIVVPSRAIAAVPVPMLGDDIISRDEKYPCPQKIQLFAR